MLISALPPCRLLDVSSFLKPVKRKVFTVTEVYRGLYAFNDTCPRCFSLTYVFAWPAQAEVHPCKFEVFLPPRSRVPSGLTDIPASSLLHPHTTLSVSPSCGSFKHEFAVVLSHLVSNEVDAMLRIPAVTSCRAHSQVQLQPGDCGVVRVRRECYLAAEPATIRF